MINCLGPTTHKRGWCRVVGAGHGWKRTKWGPAGVLKEMESIRFARPPIVELVLGAQFSRLTKITSAHLGWFWRELGGDWVVPSDAPPLDEQFELFDTPQWNRPAGALEIQLQPLLFPGRCIIHNRERDRLLQIQANRFHLNWRKREGIYPSYEGLIVEFEQLYDRFARFVESAELGKLIVNQWELTYVNAFPHGEYWQTVRDWSTVLPRPVRNANISGRRGARDQGCRMELRDTAQERAAARLRAAWTGRGRPGPRSAVSDDRPWSRGKIGRRIVPVGPGPWTCGRGGDLPASHVG